LTCYFRHLKQTFEKAGIEVNKKNKTQIDKAIHTIVGVEYKNCPATGKEVRRRLAENEEEFISELKKAMSQRA
jgi:hypothetical protein